MLMNPPEGVAEGRQIFVNLKRSIQYVLLRYDQWTDLICPCQIYNHAQYARSNTTTTLYVIITEYARFMLIVL